MNRFQSAFAPPADLLQDGLSQVTPAPIDVSHGVFQATGGKQRQSTFAPLHYEPNYAYPLIVWLHGPADDERQLKRIMPHVSMRNYVAVAPRATLPCRIEGQTQTGYAWCQTDSHLQMAEQCVFDAVTAAEKKFNIHSQRVFLAGFDSGGTMAFRLAMMNPRRFAGVLSVGGRFPVGRAPLAHLQDARRVPLFLACGRDSGTYREQQVCDDLRLFHSAGMAISLRVYPCGHELATQMLSDMDRWIMDVVTGGTARGAAGE